MRSATHRAKLSESEAGFAPRREEGFAPRREEGFALLMALVVLLLVSAAMALAAGALQLEIRKMDQRVASLQLRSESDAVVAETLARLSREPGFAGVARRPNEAGWSESRVVRPGVDRVRILATVVYRGRERRLRVDAKLTADGPVVTAYQRQSTTF